MLALTACGGGGTRIAPSSHLDDSQATISGDATTASATEAASSKPAFGSVTQSSNTDGSGVTADRASVAFSNNQATVTISGGDRTPLVLDTARDTVLSESYVSPLGGRYSYKGEALVKETANSLAVASVYTNWNNDDPNDYLAGGYWIYGEVDGAEFSHVEAGAFVDGPEIASAPTLPQSGTATYRGRSGGLYVYEYTSYPLIELGEYGTDIRLTANFNTQTISGCMGCENGVQVFGTVTNSNTGEWEALGANSPTQVHLGQTGFNNDGTFRGSTVSLSDSRIPTPATITSTGSWGGRFSNIPGDDGTPRLTAGTVGAEFTVSGDPDFNGRGGFVGAWFAVR